MPVAFRRIAPLGSLLVLFAAPVASTGIVADYKPFTLFLVWLLATYSVAAHEPNERALWGLVVAALATGFIAASGGFEDATSIVNVWIFLGVAWGLGRAIRSRETAAERQTARADRLVAEQEAQAQQILAQERTRIARELHDVVAHSVSVMVVQAGAAQRVIEGDPARARDALSSIEKAGRQALVELRRLLGVLRADDGSHGVAPQPGLAQVGELIERVRAAGIDAAIHVDGQRRALSMGADLATYRIVQEALTNVIKHSRARSVEVAIRYRNDAIEMEINDDGVGTGSANGDGAGHGLIGMRERVAMFGGALIARPGDERGFVVHARIPLDEETP